LSFLHRSLCILLVKKFYPWFVPAGLFLLSAVSGNR